MLGVSIGVIWGNAVSRFAGKFGKLKNKAKQKILSIILSKISSIALHQKEGMGCGRQVEKGGGRYSFGV